MGRALQKVTVLLMMGLILGAAAQAEQVWIERKITSGGNWFKGSPKIWGDRVYWTDWRSGNAQIYTWDEIGGERPLIGGSEARGVWAVYENKVAVARRWENTYDLYLWDPVNGERVVSTAPGDQKNADIYGETVVWEDYRNGDVPQVYIWDPVNGERSISPTNASQYGPRIWGDSVVWEDYRNGRPDVYMWNPGDGERLLVANMIQPAIYKDRVVMWMMDYWDTELDEPGLWEWTPQSGLRRLAERPYVYYEDIMFPDMWGDLVVWQYGSSIEAWDPTHGFNWVNQSNQGYAISPSVYGNKVAWIGMNDVYLSTLVPEPSGLAALSGLVLLCAIQRRKRMR